MYYNLFMLSAGKFGYWQYHVIPAKYYQILLPLPLGIDFRSEHTQCSIDLSPSVSSLFLFDIQKVYT